MPLTILIPTYNPGPSFTECLAAVERQTLLQRDFIELIVVDNNSRSEKHAFIYEQLCAIRHPRIRRRLIIERRQGAGFARLAGVVLASYEVIGCLDDDNIPAENWAQSGLNILSHCEHIGAVGGLLTPPVYAPNIIFANFAAGSYALRDGPVDRCFIYETYVGKTPPTAGCMIKKSAYLSATGGRPGILTGLTKRFPITGEDTEMFIRMEQNGWQIWHTPELCCEHRVAPQRFSALSHKRLIRGIGLTATFIRLVRYRSYVRWLITLVPHMVLDCYRAAHEAYKLVGVDGSNHFARARFWLRLYRAASPLVGGFYWLRNRAFLIASRSKMATEIVIS